MGKLIILVGVAGAGKSTITGKMKNVVVGAINIKVLQGKNYIK